MSHADVDAALIERLARDVLERDNFDPALLQETAARYRGLLQRLRAFADVHLGELPPAFAFDGAHAAYRLPPTIPPAALAGLAAGRSTGYGSAQPGPAEPEAPLATHRTDPDDLPQIVARDSLAGLGLVELTAGLRAGHFSPSELLEATFARIAALDGALHAFVTLTEPEARRAARAAEAALAQGQAGPLAGLPLVLKDLFNLAGVPTTAGSKVLSQHVPDRDATTVQRLREAGAVLVGKVSTHEFAFGVTTDTPFHGPTHNPWNPAHSPGGSSGGSAAAVAARIVPGALGTDTGGSIRIPAALCGLVGLKPSYGRVSKAGVISLSWSLDHVGPLTRSVADAALLLQVLAGPDAQDPTAMPIPVGNYLAAAQRGTARGNLRGVRMGVPRSWLEDRIHPAVKAAFDRTLALATALGAQVDEVDFPPAPLLTFVNRLITMAEGASYHAAQLAAQADDFSRGVRERFELGNFVLARDYLLAQRLRGELARQAAETMQRCDVLLVPTTPMTAPRIGQASWQLNGEVEAVPEALVRLTGGFSVTGQPAVSLPAGWDSQGLPIGIQVVARPFDEERLLEVAAALEAALGAAAGQAEGTPQG